MDIADSADLRLPSSLRSRLRASALHFALSALVAVLAATVVFVWWYPYPYRETSGGRELFQLVVLVDVVLGPLITFVIFSPHKPRAVMRRDLTVVGLLQVLALAYGLWTVFVARPVYLVFEYHRFQVVHAIDVAPSALAQAPEPLRALPMRGPGMLSLRPFKDNAEMMEATTNSLAGLPQAAMPHLWQDYASARSEVLQAAKPVAELRARFAAQSSSIDRAVLATGLPASTLAYVPLIDRQSAWTALVDIRNADVVGYLPLDPF